MKAATGELNLTVITLIAIAAVIGFFWILWPSIRDTIGNQWNDINSYDSNDQANGGGSTGRGLINNNASGKSSNNASGKPSKKTSGK